MVASIPCFPEDHASHSHVPRPQCVQVVSKCFARDDSILPNTPKAQVCKGSILQRGRVWGQGGQASSFQFLCRYGAELPPPRPWAG